MRLYSCELKGVSTALDLWLGEYHLYSSADASHSFSTNLRPWMERKNDLRVRATPSAKAGANERVLFSLEIVVVENGKRERLAYFEFPGGVAPPDIAVIPFDSWHKSLVAGQNLSFNLPDPADLVEKPWNIGGPALSTPQQIFELYGKIQRAFLQKDVGEVMSLSEARIKFGARVYNLEVAAYAARIRRDLEKTFARDPRWRIISSPERELTVHEFLPGRVMRIVTLQGGPALMTEPTASGAQSGYDVIVALTGEGLVWIL